MASLVFQYPPPQLVCGIVVLLTFLPPFLDAFSGLLNNKIHSEIYFTSFDLQQGFGKGYIFGFGFTIMEGPFFSVFFLPSHLILVLKLLSYI